MMAGTTIATMNLTTSWETRAAAGEPSATIRVDNLISTISGPQDAWGRPRRPQPVSISVEVDLSRPFSASSSGDVVDTDTVHYGLLSKEIQRILRGIEGRDADLSLADVLGEVWRGLTGWELLGRGGSGEPEGFLKASSTRHLKVTIHLPKASLLGTGVSLIGSAPMPTDAAGPAVPKSRAVTLKFHHLRVPTLIGVNDNERQAAQMVVANVEVDRWVENADGYSPLEQVITKTMTESSFETLEALATELCIRMDDYLRARYPLPHEKGWKLRISLEKPIAVPLADAPCVQLSVDTCDLRASSTTATE